MLTFPVISFLLLGAHFLREGMLGLVTALVIAPFLLFYRKRWVPVVLGILLLAGAGVWAAAGYDFTMLRIQAGMPYTRLVIIMSGVTLFTLFSAWVLLRKRTMQRYQGDVASTGVSVWVFFLTAVSLAMIQTRAPMNMLLLNRFLPGFGWTEVLVMAVYAAIVAARIHDKKTQVKWRVRAWRLFSIVFFAQLLLGLVGFNRFLMTGKLHLPVPALIVAGPIYRGHEFFMVFLFLATIALVGPAWCSHLCYIGAWDDAASRTQRRAGYYRNDSARILITILVIAAAILLRVLGAGWVIATVLSAVFGLAGVGVMVWVSRKKGTMVHCTSYCPMGLFADVLGKINPFRIRIDNTSCVYCMVCANSCRYSAITKTDIQQGKPSLTCTLCGDCVNDCPKGIIHYHFPGLSPKAARNLFIILVVTLHAVFMAVARI